MGLRQVTASLVQFSNGEESEDQSATELILVNRTALPRLGPSI